MVHRGVITTDRRETEEQPQEIVEGPVLYEDPTQTVSHVIARFGGFEKEFYVSERGARAGVLALREDRVAMVRQYRLVSDELTWEIPAGGVDEDDPIEAARRECREEAGIDCPDLRPLLALQAGMDALHLPIYLYLCDEPEDVGDAALPVRWVPMERALRMTFDGRIEDAVTVTAVLAYAARSSDQ